MRASATLRAGDWVEVKGAGEIRRTLDVHAQLEAMPFMPEMERFCGQRFQVESRAHKTCDTVDYVGGRRLLHAVHLKGLRCDGAAHGGCQALCLLFFKEAWLKRADGPGPGGDPPREVVAPSPGSASGCTEEQVMAGCWAPGESPEAPDPTWVCQATQLLHASEPLRRSDVAQYLEDLGSRNVGLGRMAAGFLFLVYATVAGGRYGIGGLLRGAFDTVSRWVGGSPYPNRKGRIPAGGKTPTRRLDLQAGDWVRVRSLPEILETVDENLRNRGMGFHSEMVPYTGRVLRVLRRIEKIVHEKTGKMVHLKNDAVILEHGTCQARYINNCRRFCPRAVYLYFREIWLERAEAPPGASTMDGAGQGR